MVNRTGENGQGSSEIIRDAMSMSEAEMDDFLLGNGVGVLSLASGNDSYSFPASYGYDADERFLCLMLGYAANSEKRDWIQTTETATFVVHELEETGEAKSVIVRGGIDEFEGSEEVAGYAALSDNATFTALHESGSLLEDTEYVIYRFSIDSMTGRKFEHDIDVGGV